jgi:DNA polymerase III delta prime subunit
MSDIQFWRPVYQLFKPDEPLMKEELRDFYVRREDSPVSSLIHSLPMENTPVKLLLAGHRGGGKTTELRRLEQRFAHEYTVIWVDADTGLERYNLGYAEVIVLIGLEILKQVVQPGWKLSEKLKQALMDSLKKVIYDEAMAGDATIQMPKLLQDAGFALKVGKKVSTAKQLNILPDLSEIISRVNAIIQAAEQQRQQKLLVIVDGLDRHELRLALEMFSSNLLIALECHTIYSIPIALRYSPAFRQPMENFQRCLDLVNPPVFTCDANGCPTPTPNRLGRHILASVIEKRLSTLGERYKTVFQPEAMDQLCENSGGIMRDLIRLAQTACQIALGKQASEITLAIAKAAIKEERKIYTIRDYHYTELDIVHRTGQLTSNVTSLPGQGEIVICDELLQYKLVLGYEDAEGGRWFDINPILLADLERWQVANAAKNHEPDTD